MLTSDDRDVRAYVATLGEGPLIGLAQSSDPGEIEYTRLGEIIRCPWRGWEFDAFAPGRIRSMSSRARAW
jgi:hypothetical protein